MEEQLNCLKRVVNWLVLTRVQIITIYDQTGVLEKQVKEISKDAKKVKDAYELTVSDKQFQKGEHNGDKNQSKVIIKFMTEEDNKKDLLNTISKRSAYLKKNPSQKAELKTMEDYVKYEQKIYKQMAVLPHLILVFNSKRRVLKMPGFPCLLKETAEILECGPLNTEDFRALEFVQCIEKYASI